MEKATGGRGSSQISRPRAPWLARVSFPCVCRNMPRVVAVAGIGLAATALLFAWRRFARKPVLILFDDDDANAAGDWCAGEGDYRWEPYRINTTALQVDTIKLSYAGTSSMQILIKIQILKLKVQELITFQ